METTWNTALWRQMGAAIDVLDNALAACPDDCWTERVWREPPPPYFPPQFGECWYVAFHTVVWLDLYLAGVPEEEFAPPPAFPRGEVDSNETLPSQPYARETVRAYLANVRERARATLLALTDEQARRPVSYSWSRGQSISYFELQLYSMRHVQEHAAQLGLFLGDRGVPGAVLDWVPRAKDEAAEGR